MKRVGPIGHGLLLCGAVVLAYTTWTRDTSVKVTRGEVTIWGGAPASVKAIRLESAARTARLERRGGAGDDGYLWGTVVRQPPPATPKEGEPPAALSSPADVPPPVPATTKEFPINDAGTSLVEKVAPLRGLRELGTLDEAKRAEYGLDDVKDALIVEFESGEAKELSIGGRVFGGNDRYVIEKATGKAWVIQGEIITPLEGAETSLRETKLHGFLEDAVGQVSVQSGERSRTVVRKGGPELGTPGPHGQPPSPTSRWADVKTPDTVDQTLGNIMDRVGKLSALEYVSEPIEGLSQVAAFEYKDKDGKVLGHTELWKKPGAKEGEHDYWLKSERTRVFARVSRPAAERVEQDLTPLFGP